MVKSKSHTIRILNISRQEISIQARPPHGDFFLHEQQVRLRPGVSALLPKDHLIPEQITNLRAKGFIKVVFDSEAGEGE